MSGSTPANVARAAYDAFAAGDLEALGALLSEDTHWQIGDAAPLNGDYHGRDEVFGNFLGRLMEITGGTLRLEVHDVMGSDKHACGVVRERAERDGKVLDAWTTHLFQVQDGKVIRFWASSSDPNNRAFWD